MSDTLDRDEVAAALGELRRLVHRLGEVRAGFDAAGAAADLDEARARAFALSSEVPESRVFGVLDRVTGDELRALLSAATPDAAKQRALDELLATMRRAPKLHRAMAHVHPYSFAPVGTAWWEAYRATLRALPEQPLWGVPEPHRVPLGGIYLPGRFRRAKASEADERPVEVDPEPSLRQWMIEGQRLVFVVGGPGSGKSTLATMLAADLADDALLQPLLIRLRDVSPERDLFEEIARVLRETLAPPALGEGLAGVFDRAPRLVLLLDGFDELIQASRTGLGSFFLRLEGLLRDHRVQGITCFGRDTVFERDDTSIPERATVIELLPFDDAQVARWCERWREVTGRELDWQTLRGVDGSDDEVVHALIHEPLTLRLLALLDLEGVSLVMEGGVDLARVYRHVVSATCARHQAERGDFTAAELRRLLRVIGFAVVQSGQEAIRRDDLQRALAALDLRLDTDKTGSRAIQLILAISQRRSREDETAWEFLHKSIGEYLAAEFLAVEIAAMVAQERDEFGETRYRLSDAAFGQRWIERFGVAVIPVGVERFLAQMAGDWRTFFERGLVKNTDCDLVALGERLGGAYRALLDEAWAETALRTARAWSLRPGDVAGIALANVFLACGLRGGADACFAPEVVAPGRYVEAYHVMRRPLTSEQWYRVTARTSFQGVAEGSDLSGLNLGGSDWWGVQAVKVLFLQTSFSFATIESSTFTGCNFYGSSILNGTVVDSSFTGCWMAHSNWARTYLHGVQFDRCSFLAGDTDEQKGLGSFIHQGPDGQFVTEPIPLTYLHSFTVP